MNIKRLIQNIFTSTSVLDDCSFDIKESITERSDLEYCDLTYIKNERFHCFNVVYKFNDDFDYQEASYDLLDNYTESEVKQLLLKLKNNIITCKTDLQIQQEIEIQYDIIMKLRMKTLN